MNIHKAIKEFGIRHKWFRILFCIFWFPSWPTAHKRSRVMSRYVNQAIDQGAYEIKGKGILLYGKILIKEGCDRWEYQTAIPLASSSYIGLHRETNLRLHWLLNKKKLTSEQELDQHLSKLLILGDEPTLSMIQKTQFNTQYDYLGALTNAQYMRMLKGSTQ